MTNWMWFVSGVIAGGLITGVTSFFIFKKKKDEMERKYTDMVNEFFRHDDDNFKKDMDDAVKTAKEVIDILIEDGWDKAEIEYAIKQRKK